MDELPKQYLLEYVTKRTKKDHPTWPDINELKIAMEQSIGIMCESSNEDAAMNLFDEKLEKIRYDVFKIGLMVSFIHPDHPDIIAIGFSLCNLSAYDKFDYIISKVRTLEQVIAAEGRTLYEEAEGFGKHIAVGRALSWCYTSTKKQYKVPESIKHQFRNFALRSKRYYKGKRFPTWIEVFLDS